jgi:hypothetical protein
VDAARNQPDSQAPVALVILTVIVYVAGFAMVASWFALLVLGQPAAQPDTSASRAFATCNVCGVVERVGEFERERFQLSGDPGESFVVVLASLGGLKTDAAPGRMYETAVRHDDGSVRVVRDSSAPQWKNGDRVRVVRGRVELAGR